MRRCSKFGLVHWARWPFSWLQQSRAVQREPAHSGALQVGAAFEVHVQARKINERVGRIHSRWSIVMGSRSAPSPARRAHAPVLSPTATPAQRPPTSHAALRQLQQAPGATCHVELGCPNATCSDAYVPNGGLPYSLTYSQTDGNTLAVKVVRGRAQLRGCCCLAAPGDLSLAGSSRAAPPPARCPDDTGLPDPGPPPPLSPPRCRSAPPHALSAATPATRSWPSSCAWPTGERTCHAALATLPSPRRPCSVATGVPTTHPAPPTLAIALAPVPAASWATRVGPSPGRYRWGRR